MILSLDNVTFLEPGTFLPGSNSNMKTFFAPRASGGLTISYDTSTQLVTMAMSGARRLIHVSRVRDMVPSPTAAEAPPKAAGKRP